MDCINCTDYFCTDYSHIVGIQNFHDSLIASCIEASKVIPVSISPKKIQAGMNTLNATNKLRNFGTLFGRNVAPLLKVKLLKL